MNRISHENAELLQLAAQIKARNESMGPAETNHLSLWIKNGHDAIRAKKLAGHGMFQFWVERHAFDHSAINEMMLLARNEQAIAEAGCQSIRQALKLLRLKKTPKSEGEATNDPGETNTELKIDLAAVNAWFEEDPINRVDEFLAGPLSAEVRIALMVAMAKVSVRAKKMRDEARDQNKMFRNKGAALAAAVKAKAPSQAQIDETTTHQSEAQVINLADRRGLSQSPLH
jgi:hypothetical protein